MKAHFNGIAPLKSGEEILVIEGEIYEEELVITELKGIDTGILYIGPKIPSQTRANLVRNMKFRVSNVVVDCNHNKTTFDAEDI